MGCERWKQSTLISAAMGVVFRLESMLDRSSSNLALPVKSITLGMGLIRWHDSYCIHQGFLHREVGLEDTIAAALAGEEHAVFESREWLCSF
jgi:hypothetical protein